MIGFLGWLGQISVLIGTRITDGGTQANVPYMKIIQFASYDYHINRAPYDNHDSLYI